MGIGVWFGRGKLLPGSAHTRDLVAFYLAFLLTLFRSRHWTVVLHFTYLPTMADETELFVDIAGYFLVLDGGSLSFENALRWCVRARCLRYMWWTGWMPVVPTTNTWRMSCSRAPAYHLLPTYLSIIPFSSSDVLLFARATFIPPCATHLPFTLYTHTTCRTRHAV